MLTERQPLSAKSVCLAEDVHLADGGAGKDHLKLSERHRGFEPAPALAQSPERLEGRGEPEPDPRGHVFPITGPEAFWQSAYDNLFSTWTQPAAFTRALRIINQPDECPADAGNSTVSATGPTEQGQWQVPGASQALSPALLQGTIPKALPYSYSSAIQPGSSAAPKLDFMTTEMQAISAGPSAGRWMDADVPNKRKRQSRARAPAQRTVRNNMARQAAAAGAVQPCTLKMQLTWARSNLACKELPVLDNRHGYLDDLFDRIGYRFRYPELLQALAFVVVPEEDRIMADHHDNHCLVTLGHDCLVKALTQEMKRRYWQLENPDQHASYVALPPRMFSWSIRLGLPGYAVSASSNRIHNQALSQLEICSLTEALFGAILLDGGPEASNSGDEEKPAQYRQAYCKEAQASYANPSCQPQ
ncbi:hypothetical protein WJX73_009605 [Symbiochloris irregularis]|uniref:Uncharacterized protein n=1 Tax=Symbiochloris irregularis TaxID=706552 RepID=A0AAW1PG86_9CHLO